MTDHFIKKKKKEKKRKIKENKAENKLKIPYPSLSLSFLCLYTNNFLLFLSVCIHSIIQQGLPLKISSTELEWIKNSTKFPQKMRKKNSVTWI